MLWPCSSVSRMTVRLKRCAEVLKRSDTSICRFNQRRVRDEAAARVGMIVQIEREHAHEARERFHSCHDEGRRREHDLALAQSVAVDLGFGEMGDEVLGRARAAQSHLGGEEVAELLEGGDM